MGEPRRTSTPSPRSNRSSAMSWATTSGSAGTSRSISTAREQVYEPAFTTQRQFLAPGGQVSSRHQGGERPMSQEVGRVLGSDPAHPLEFWVGVTEDSYLQLDDIVAVTTPVPGREEITIYGIVDMVRARYEGAKFDSDVFRVAEGVLPVGIATAAHVSVTRIEPEVFVAPSPGQTVFRVQPRTRDMAR